MKVLLIEKHVILLYSLLNMKKQLFLMGLVLCLSRISLGRYCLKNVVKSGDWEKRYKGGMAISKRGVYL